MLAGLPATESAVHPTFPPFSSSVCKPPRNYTQHRRKVRIACAPQSAPLPERPIVPFLPFLRDGWSSPITKQCTVNKRPVSLAFYHTLSILPSRVRAETKTASRRRKQQTSTFMRPLQQDAAQHNRLNQTKKACSRLPSRKSAKMRSSGHLQQLSLFLMTQASICAFLYTVDRWGVKKRVMQGVSR